MKFIKNKLSMLTLACSAILIIGCDKEEDTVVTPVVTPTAYTIPETYEFKDSQGRNTVDFNGQKQRLNMLDEMMAYIKTGNTKGTVISATVLKAMYANNNYTWSDTDNLGMTGSSKQLKDKTAKGDQGVIDIIEAYMDSIALFSQNTADGGSGVGGVWPQDGGKGPYLMSGAGVNYSEMIEKTLMSAVFLNQITDYYLVNTVNADNIVPYDTANQLYHTEMERFWDEAYGYFTSQVDFPTTGTDRFWGKYVEGRNGVLNSKDKIAEAFRRGRAAINARAYTERDAQIEIIRTELEKVAAASAIHYLNAAKANIAIPIIKNQALSEALGFVGGLKYSYNVINGKSISASEIDQVLAHMGSNFNIVTITSLNNAIDLLASKTGLEAEKAVL